MEFNNININMLDIILFLGILISLIIGYSRGFVKEALSIINWLLAAWLAFKYYSDLKTITLSFIETNIIADAISFGILFLFSIIILTILSNLFSKNLWFNRPVIPSCIASSLRLLINLLNFSDKTIE